LCVSIREEYFPFKFPFLYLIHNNREGEREREREGGRGREREGERERDEMSGIARERARAGIPMFELRPSCRQSFSPEVRYHGKGRVPVNVTPNDT